jgi:(S)-2-hydroxy-acid oxidase
LSKGGAQNSWKKFILKIFTTRFRHQRVCYEAIRSEHLLGRRKMANEVRCGSFAVDSGPEKTNFYPFCSFHRTHFICSFSRLPVILKGIMTREDARLACKLGVAGIMVSNHGARQIDNTASSIEALADIAAEVKGEIPIFFDGGVRQGTDVFIALALGATMCFIGRPVVYGLACQGQEGVEDVLRILKREFDLTMCLAGVKNVREINSDMVVHKNYYARL